MKKWIIIQKLIKSKAEWDSYNNNPFPQCEGDVTTPLKEKRA